jgi:hypothetical protein
LLLRQSTFLRKLALSQLLVANLTDSTVYLLSRKLT